jgi:hypothetical protein
VIAARTIENSFPFPVEDVDCHDNRPPSSCPFDESFVSFNAECPNCGLLVHVNSDTWIRPERLHRHLRDLENVYVPREHIVFRGHAQNGTAGGPVVMSRGVADVHVPGDERRNRW